jgi:hypothetical protein
MRLSIALITVVAVLVGATGLLLGCSGDDDNSDEEAITEVGISSPLPSVSTTARGPALISPSRGRSRSAARLSCRIRLGAERSQ